MKTVLVAIAKNEGPYIREWVFYHKVICGFDHIHIYNNDSSDNSKDELNSLSSQGLCSWEEWPRSSYNPPQQKAYHNAMHKLRNEFDWLCFMDLDEFLVLNSYDHIEDCVSKFDEQTGSISFNWAMFYSLDKKKTPEPVIKRVNYCYGNPHVKTIARTKAIRNCAIHTFDLLPGYKYMHASGLEYRLDEKIKASVDLKICTKKEYWICNVQKAQINHYQMKSDEEVLARDVRGRATVAKHTPKTTAKDHNYAKNIKDHQTNNNIKTFIERRYGLEKFYQDIRSENERTF